MSESREASPHLAILMPMAWSVRNVLTSGLLERLVSSGVRVTLLVADGVELRAASLPDSVQVEAMLVPPIKASFKGRTLLNQIEQAAHQRRHGVRSYAIFRRWLGRHESLLQRARRGLIEGSSLMLQSDAVRELVTRILEYLYSYERDLSVIHDQLRRIRPSAVYSTVAVSALEFPYLMVARSMGLTTITSVLSFDNLTSRGMLPVCDWYLVWNDRMRGQVLRLYPHVEAPRVAITGTPQFDFHGRSEFLWSRAETLSRLGLPRGARYLVYTANHAKFTPTEPQLVRMFRERLEVDAELRDLWVVVRTHPLDDVARWDQVVTGVPRVVMSKPFTGKDGVEEARLSDGEQQCQLVSTLRHAEMCCTVASTTALDAALLDRPVIGVAFASEPGSAEDLAYRSFYETDHYKPLVESGGMRIAGHLDELVALTRMYLRDPSIDRKRRLAMIKSECGEVDGKAAERVSTVLKGILRQRALVAGG